MVIYYNLVAALSTNFLLFSCRFKWLFKYALDLLTCKKI